MATQPVDRYTIEQYVDLEERLDYRSEFHDGVILPVEAATFTHASLEARIVAALTKAFPACAVCGSSLNLYIAGSNRIVHPDATVVCGPVHYAKRDCIDNPTVIAEVTSPSTKDYDYGTKREEYFSFASLEHYLLVSQTERAVGHYQRSGDGWIYVDRREDAVISLGKIEISVAEIYAGILG